MSDNKRPKLLEIPHKNVFSILFAQAYLSAMNSDDTRTQVGALLVHKNSLEIFAIMVGKSTSHCSPLLP